MQVDLSRERDSHQSLLESYHSLTSPLGRPLDLWKKKFPMLLGLICWRSDIFVIVKYPFPVSFFNPSSHLQTLTLTYKGLYDSSSKGTNGLG
jgi:hypothetical protein